MNRIDNYQFNVHYPNATSFYESTYHYDIRGSSITFYQNYSIDDRHLLYRILRPFCYLISQFLNIFSFFSFYRRKPAEFEQISLTLFSGKTPNLKNLEFLKKEGFKTIISLDASFEQSPDFKTCTCPLDLSAVTHSSLQRLIKAIHESPGPIYIYSNELRKRQLLARIIDHFYLSKTEPNYLVTGNRFTEVTHNLFCGPAPVLRQQFKLLTDLKFNTIFCLNPAPMPHQTNVPGLRYVAVHLMPGQDIEKFAQEIKDTIAPGEKVYFYSQNPDLLFAVCDAVKEISKSETQKLIGKFQMRVEDHTQITLDIFCGPIPIFPADFELLENEKFKTIFCLDNTPIPPEAKGLGLTFTPVKITSADDIRKIAHEIKQRSSFGTKVYFYSENSGLTSSVWEAVKEITQSERQFQRQELRYWESLDPAQLD